MSGSLALEPVDVPPLEDAHADFEDVARNDQGVDLTDDERLDALENAVAYRETLQHFNERAAEINAKLERLEDLEERLAKLEQQRGLEGNAGAGGIDEEQLPSPGTTADLHGNTETETGGLPSPGTANSVTESNEDDAALPSPGTANATTDDDRKVPPKSTVANDRPPRRINVVDPEDVDPMTAQRLERVIARSDDHSRAEVLESVRIVNDADAEKVILVDPYASGATRSSRNRTATEVVPTNPEQLPSN